MSMGLSLGLGLGSQGAGGAGSLTITGTASPATWGVPYPGGALGVAGGTAPFVFSGLPGGMTSSVVGSTILPVGTPA